MPIQQSVLIDILKCEKYKHLLTALALGSSRSHY